MSASAYHHFRRGRSRGWAGALVQIGMSGDGNPVTRSRPSCSRISVRSLIAFFRRRPFNAPWTAPRTAASCLFSCTILWSSPLLFHRRPRVAAALLPGEVPLEYTTHTPVIPATSALREQRQRGSLSRSAKSIPEPAASRDLTCPRQDVERAWNLLSEKPSRSTLLCGPLQLPPENVETPPFHMAAGTQSFSRFLKTARRETTQHGRVVRQDCIQRLDVVQHRIGSNVPFEQVADLAANLIVLRHRLPAPPSAVQTAVRQSSHFTADYWPRLPQAQSGAPQVFPVAELFPLLQIVLERSFRAIR